MNTLVFQVGVYTVRRVVRKSSSAGYDVYQEGATAATRRGQFGDGPKYLHRAIEYAKQLHDQDDNNIHEG